MHPDFLGDSYDIVKHTLVQWLAPLGDWSIHPMFRFSFTPAFVQAYESLVGAPTITHDPIPHGSGRTAHIGLAASRVNVLFDPDTGIKTRGERTRRHLMADELVSAVRARAGLTLVFDQSLSRGQQRDALAAKVRFLQRRRLPAFGYFSHACFVVASPTRALTLDARALLLSSGVPADRLL